MSLERAKLSTHDYHNDLTRALGNSSELNEVLQDNLGPDHTMYAIAPFGEMNGVEAVYDGLWTPFGEAFSEVQFDTRLFMGGYNDEEPLGETDTIEPALWICRSGIIRGTFSAPFLGLRPTEHEELLPFVEFNQFDEATGRITTSALHIDIINFLREAVGYDPVPQQTGRRDRPPFPPRRPALQHELEDPDTSAASLAVVKSLITTLKRFNEEGTTDQVPDEFAQDFIWAGPDGIGMAGGEGSLSRHDYLERHQRPFRTGLVDNTFQGHEARIADGRFVAFFGWPNLTNRATGFLGLTSDHPAEMRVVDLYEIDDTDEGKKIVTNRVFIDLPYYLLQHGIDVIKDAQDHSRSVG